VLRKESIVARILVVDNEKSICSTIETAFKTLGHFVEVAESGEVAIVRMDQSLPDILLTDLRMDGMSGLDLLKKSQEYSLPPTVVVMTAYGTIDTAVTAMKNGAYDYLVKPFTLDQLQHLIDRIEKHRASKEENAVAKSSDVSLEELEKQHIRDVLNVANTLEEAASTLGINLSTLWRKRRKYGLE
jgi:DNA-binding NtrC family response regulator